MKPLEVADLVRLLAADVYVTDDNRVSCDKPGCVDDIRFDFLDRVCGRHVNMATVLQALRDHLDEDH